ncbi:MauE/DoxX family redox-associated membrane protein [Nocardia asteroides]|uniref:MauE/DoxX family redox-associated membrane protein n=1 Tax=Nocardia asteroides TaxID=1824 RepID=UPI00342B5225
MHAIAALILGVFLVAVGVSHFLAPAYYRSLVPAVLPRPDLLVAASGGAEIVVGGCVAMPATRAFGAWAALTLLCGYLVLWLTRLLHARTNRAATAAAATVNAAYVAWAAFLATTGA